MTKRFIIIALAYIALLCGCQVREKHVYRLPTSAHLAELEQQERAYEDSLNKYCAVADTAQISRYLALWQAARDTSSAVLRQEANAFVEAVEEAAASERNSLTSTECVLIYAAFILLIALLIYLCTVNMLWTRIGWFFQDLWKRLKRNFNDPYHNSLLLGPCFGPENLSDEDIHEIMNIIHNGNPPKYKIVREEKKNGRIIRATCEVEKEDAESDTTP